MKDYFTLGPVPAEEDCESLGSDYDARRARKECRAYRDQLIRIFGRPPGDASFETNSFPHEYGNYLDVCVVFNIDALAERDFAISVENSLPLEWDAEARRELGL